MSVQPKEKIPKLDPQLVKQLLSGRKTAGESAPAFRNGARGRYKQSGRSSTSTLSSSKFAMKDESSRRRSMSLYVAVGVNLEGRKELLGLWLSEGEGAKFYLQLLNELASRGVEDIFIACVDGLKGLPEAIESVF